MDKKDKVIQDKHLDALPKVSIITVCYNSVKTIEDTIKSVVNQTYSNVEYIIVDGGSTDGTVEIIKKYEKHIAKWISEPDEGIYDAMNKGISLASGELIGIINSDDWLLPETTDIVVNRYKTNQGVDVLYGNCKIIRECNEYIKKPLTDIKKERFKSMPINHPGSFITKRSYDDLGGYSTEFRLASDYELILRFIDKGKAFSYIDKTLSIMREGGASSDFIRSFNEARIIKRNYNCNRFLADYYFLKSRVKTYLYMILSRCSVMKKYVFYYKNRNR